MNSNLLYFFISLCCTYCALCLKILSIDVPRVVKPGEDVKLNCAFDLQGSKLYSMKWHKDGVEFYSYLPTIDNKKRFYENIGVAVNKDKSSGGHVYLDAIDLHSSGSYMCEVSADKPTFYTRSRQAYMTVYSLPKKKWRPRITGEKDLYNLGDQVKFNCTAPISAPAANITWYINKIKVSKTLSKTYLEVVSVRNGKMFIATSVLIFKLSDSSFINGKARIQCHANVLDLYNKTGEILLERETNLWNEVRTQQKISSPGSSLRPKISHYCTFPITYYLFLSTMLFYNVFWAR